MILVDTSVWVDHFRAGVPRLADLLNRSQILMHALVLGEIACGNLRNRAGVLALLQQLPAAAVATEAEALALIERRRLHGRGIGYIDVHLLASSALSDKALLWTRDLRLRRAAVALDCDYGSRLAH